MTRFTILLLLIGVIGLIVLIAIYNGLVYKRNRVRKNAYSSIDVNLRKRFDLIPALVETVKGFAKHEEETFTRLIEARQRIDRGDLSQSERFRVESQIGPGLQRLMAIAEDYPELRSSSHFLNLQRNLTRSKNRSPPPAAPTTPPVFEINNAVESFPSNLVAGAFGFQLHDFFEAADGERDSVGVSL